MKRNILKKLYAGFLFLLLVSPVMAEDLSDDEMLNTENEVTEISDENEQNEKASKKEKKKAKKEKKAKESKKKEKKNKKNAKETESELENSNYSGWIDNKVKSLDENFGTLKFRTKNKLGSFNIALVKEDSKKCVPLLSTSDEYTTSGFFLRAGKKIVELNKDSGVIKSGWKTDSGIALGYRIENLADVIIYFDTFQSDADFDVDSMKVTAQITNTGKKKESFAVKIILDTILGETDRHHFYTCKNEPVKNEFSFRENEIEGNEWFLSKNSSAALQVILAGGECTKPSLVAFANYSTLYGRTWEPNLLSYKAFDTVLSYNNSAAEIIWPDHKLGTGEQIEEIFYLSTALGDRIPSGASFVQQNVQVNNAKNDDSNYDDFYENEFGSDFDENQENVVDNLSYVDVNVNPVSADKLSQEYIQNLLDRISKLEESDEKIDEEELRLLNAELDAILLELKM